MSISVHLLLGPETGEKEQTLKQIRDALKKRLAVIWRCIASTPSKRKKGKFL